MTHRFAWMLSACLLPAMAVQAERIFESGFEGTCEVDSDGDRLIDCLEVALQTDLWDPDTDDDGLGDGDEVLGTTAGLDLPGMGVKPRRKDILLEHDWGNDNSDQNCATHTHKPGIAAINELTIAFAAMPIANPDGSSGINLIQDHGQGGLFTGGNLVPVANGVVIGRIDADFQAYKASNFAANRLGYFHYAIHTHRYSAGPQNTGTGEIVGDDFLVTLRCNLSHSRVRNTVMHELGHNLGLRHGGDSNCNHKPNYNSIMNYPYQLAGIDVDCQLGGDGVMNYSLGVRAPLDENHLDESAGMCGGVAIDWNTQDGGVLTDTSHDLNAYTTGTPVPDQIQDCGGVLTTLTDHDDFAALYLAGLPNAPDGGVADPAEVASCQPFDSE